MLRFPETTGEDLEALAQIRIAAMRESLYALGRFDPLRARQRLIDSFQSQYARWIELDGERIGFYQLRPVAAELRLDHLYLLPDHQGKGHGSAVLKTLIEEANSTPMTLAALKESPANDFYIAHGFQKVETSEWDIEYRRP